jgi:hypothetical protein
LHHRGRQVGLGQQGRSLSLSAFFGGEPQALGQLPCQLLLAFSFLGHRPQLFMENNAGQLRYTIGQRNRLVLAEKQAGVFQATVQGLFIPTHHRRFASRRAVSKTEEIREQAAGIITDWDLFLVVAHDRGEDFGREFQVIAVKAAPERGGVFQ